MLVVGLTCVATHAKEVYTNGVGGGAWDEPMTWRGESLPTAQDTVVIRRDDRVVFEGVERDGPLCAKLVLDPDSVLRIKPTTDRPKAQLTFDGPIDCYGTIQADLAQHPDTSVAIKLMAKESERRRLTLRDGGALLLYGSEDLLENRRNIVVTTAEDAANDETLTATLDAREGAKIDVRWAQFENVSFNAEDIDNTGYSVGEGLTIAHNRFVGRSRLMLISCDTATVLGNEFHASVEGVLGRAIDLRASPLASFRDNHVHGSYSTGIQVLVSDDFHLAGNTIEGLRAGVSLNRSSGSVERLELKNCEYGLRIDNDATVTLENSTIIGSKQPVEVSGATVQLTSVEAQSTDESMPLLTLTDSSATLLNCPFKPEDINVESPPKDLSHPVVRAFAYLIVKVAGKPDRTMRLDVRTKDAASDRVDLNVRHAPSSLRLDGLSPLPHTRKALEVLSWTMAADGTVTSPPTYTLSVFTPPTSPEGAREVHGARQVTPDESWYRKEPDATHPTVEVSIP
ncbi:MAG: right-handed parallel beta-helix repeat-containing protein [bacterium]